MGALSPLHLILLLVIVLIVFGPGKLPDIGSALGRGLRDRDVQIAVRAQVKRAER